MMGEYYSRMNKYVVLACISGGVFLAMLLFMQFDPDDYLMLDTWATHFARPFQTVPWVDWFAALTWLGSVTGIGVVAIATAAIVHRTPGLVLRLATLLAAEALSVEAVKSLIGRIRPDALPGIGPLHSFSFPSGHSASIIALYGFIAIVFIPRLPTRPLRIALAVLVLLIVLGVGVSRIVLAAHFFSDVLAGYLLGALWLALTLLTLPARERRASAVG
jgi:membrane-associated phospholipid phosphatase